MKARLTLSASLASLLVLGAASAFAAPSPQDFLKTAIEGDNSEIALGQLAADKSSDPRVQEFGKMLVADHTTAKKEAVAVGDKMNVMASDKPSDEARAEQTKLSSLSGPAFDKEFATYMVDDHQKDIQAFEDEARANQGPVSDLATKQLPVLRKHLEMAESLAKNPKSASAAPAVGKTAEDSDQWRASKLVGVPIYGPDNQKVGAVTDVLMNREGKADTVVVGVGGFLGLGEKDVAIAFDAVKFTDSPVAKSLPVMDSTMNPSNTQNAAMATGSGSAPGANRSSAYPDHGVIDMSKDQLKQAPSFHFAT